jgi:small subunit ribosomal protein S5
MTKNKTAPKKEETAYSESLVHVGRVTKVVKGGRKFSFSACVVTGNHKGLVGYGHAKAKEVGEARTKASQEAKKDMIKVPLLNGRTLYHDVIAKKGAGKVLLRKAKPGTGIIAGGAMRAVFESLGIKDIVAKSLGSSNVYNIIAATFAALQKMSTPKKIAARRNKQVKEILPEKNKKENVNE